MAEFRMKVAGRVAWVQTLFESTPQYCRAYWTEESADFSVTVQRSDLAFEQAQLDEEAALEGFRRRQFTDPFLERAAIQRAFAENLLLHDTLLLHGSAVAVDGEGYLFMARSGTGKSTHTRLWREVFGQRAVMVNDDKPFLHIGEREITMFGAPWSGKHGLDSNISVPLKGICLLERGAENSICPVNAQDLLPFLRHQAYQPLTESGEAATELLLQAISERILLWKMWCNPTPDAAQVAYEAMRK